MSANTSVDRQPYILGSFALLARFADEPGGKTVTDLLRDAGGDTADVYMTTVNNEECAYIIERQRGIQAARAAIAAVDQLPITLVKADRALSLDAAHIKANYPLSYADAFAAALTRQLAGILLTSDPEFRAIEHLVTIRWLPQRDT
jgi:predicted nucleic acid-binding protein